MRSDLDVDLAVIGAGAAGLMLAGALAGQGRRLRLMVLEPRQLKPNPRLWLFPARPGHALERFVSTRLDRVSIQGVERGLETTRLDVVRASDVQAAALDQLSAAGAGGVEEDVRIDALTPTAGGVELRTSRGAFTARTVVDTRPGALAGVPEGCWTQIGWFVALPTADITPGFALSRADSGQQGVLMEQSLALADGGALIEMVGLCPPGEDGEIVKARLQARISDLGADPAAHELRRAVLPLNTLAAPEPIGSVIAAPAGAGGLRFGPGLAALRLACWAQTAAPRLANTGHLNRPPAIPASQRIAAAQLVRQLERGPQTAASWLNARLSRLSTDAALRFLGGAPSWRDHLVDLQYRWTGR